MLGPSDPPPVRVFNPQGASSFLLIGDHAGNAVPSVLGTLRLSDADLRRHIALDIGIFELGVLLADALDAVFFSQVYSRLVIDCNRDPSAFDSIASKSDTTIVPGNEGLSQDARACRIAEIHEPYHAAIAEELVRRDRLDQETILIALHSFTPSLKGSDRPWHVGVLHDRGNTALAARLRGILGQRGDLIVGDNQPYVMDATDYTIPRHAYALGRPYVELEIRQDLLDTPTHRQKWSDILATALLDAARPSDIALSEP